MRISKAASTTPNKTQWDIDDYNDVVNLWNLSDEDQQNMRELEQRLGDIEYWKNAPHEVIRYLKEYKNVNKTENMFRDMIRWRIDKDMDGFLERYGEPDSLLHQMPIAVLNTADRDGDPIYIDRMGATDSWGVLKHFGTDAVTDYIIMIRELQESRAFWKPYEDMVGHRIRRFRVIIDLQGLSTTHARPGLLPLLNRTARISQDMYSGRVKRIILLRAPSIFKMIWSVAKHFFDQHIQDMIVFATVSDYLEVIQDYIDLENLPPCIAPEDGKAGAIPGYFEKVSLEGGTFNKTRKDNVMSVKKQTPDCSLTESVRSASEVMERGNMQISTKVLIKGLMDVDCQGAIVVL